MATNLVEEDSDRFSAAMSNMGVSRADKISKSLITWLIIAPGAPMASVHTSLRHDTYHFPPFKCGADIEQRAFIAH